MKLAAIDHFLGLEWKTWLAVMNDLPLLHAVLARTSFFRIDKAMSSLLFVASAGRFTGYDPG
jgi:hypothetical protein